MILFIEMYTYYIEMYTYYTQILSQINSFFNILSLNGIEHTISPFVIFFLNMIVIYKLDINEQLILKVVKRIFKN